MARTDPHFRLRLPAELKARIEHAAAMNHRSINAEIVSALEAQHPKPPTIEETVADIEQTVKLMKRWRGHNMLQHLADQLDYLVADISRDQSAPPEVRKAADEYIENAAKFTRIVPPEDF